VDNLSPNVNARIAGALYLFIIIGGMFAELGVRDRLIVSGDAAATAASILAHQALFRQGFAVELLIAAANIPLGVIYWRLFSPVSRALTTTAVAFMFIASAIQAVFEITHYAPLLLLSGSPSLAGLSAPQIHALAYQALRLQSAGYNIALTFYGFSDIAVGALIFRSGFFPRLIGLLMALAGICYIVNAYSIFLDSPLDLFPWIMAPCLIGEGGFTLWLLFAGVDDARWRGTADDPLKRMPGWV
jgi:hypothetical protein